ncbi:MAG: hypothetical protein WB014_00480 [Methanosarcina sp.]
MERREVSPEGSTALSAKLEMFPSESDGTELERKEFPGTEDSVETEGPCGKTDEPAATLPEFSSGKEPEKFPEKTLPAWFAGGVSRERRLSTALSLFSKLLML